ncbi:AAA family ATPase [Streptomyces aidingensis]|uniref:C-terminal, D2-small domain-containing protein, of ClpB protein n=1 Tax=Streptomyces aidingensis TaxID=910347 RepID=A0A1I1QUI3_9ACTN|nr:AAA family ATPase [Streptomyces aidingensis]SFD25804.1 C-terminal, D2-small domain-containing protein, of ClpB protein [Streptomyces aidingensis]
MTTLRKTPPAAGPDTGGPAVAGVRELPSFAEELTGTLSVHCQYVLHGNIRDIHLVRVPGGGAAGDQHTTLINLLWNLLRREGYEALVRFDRLDGFTVFPAAAEPRVEAVLGRGRIGGRARNVTVPGLETLSGLLRALARGLPEGTGRPAEPGNGAPGGAGPESGTGTGPGPGPAAAAPPLRAAILVDYASRIPGDVSRLEHAERDFFLDCLKTAHEAVPLPAPGGRRLFNPLIWLADGERDLPVWLVSGSDRVRTIGVPLPGQGERARMARLLALEYEGLTAAPDGPAPPPPSASPPSPPSPPSDQEIEEFTRATTGLTLRAMRETVRLAVDRMMPFSAMPDAVRIYRLGIEDSPWRRPDMRAHIARGEQYIRSRVQGQTAAVDQTMDILKRAAMGLSGAHATHSGHRPRGVLFFAGPTGTGKTELAKSIAKVLFGDEDACLRFDMSEFSAPHAADRLVGAPPGYVGYEAGGELTSAVRANPFRVVLFDEIEKADKGVLDKFLQVLEDGRLTDGQGITTHFSECVLIFTSNLGVMREDPATGLKVRAVEPGTGYREFAGRVQANVRHHFVQVIGRPELLNRFGGNIVVFDWIGPEVARRIYRQQTDNIRRALWKEQRIDLRLSEDADRQLAELCTRGLDDGGRGIGNALETRLVNPLARALFDTPAAAGSRVTVARVEERPDGTVRLELRTGDGP